MMRAGSAADATLLGLIALFFAAFSAGAFVLPIDISRTGPQLADLLPCQVTGPLAVEFVATSDDPSGIGRVTTYRAEIAGAPIFDATVRLHRDDAGHPRWLVVTDELWDALAAWPQRCTAYEPNGLWDHPPAGQSARGWHLRGDRLTPAFAITSADERVTILDAATGGKLAVHDLVRRLTGRGLVFDPNPVIAAGNPDLREGDDVDPWRIEVPLRDLDGSGRLQGSWVTVENPAGGAFSLTGRYCFSSRDLHFEEVMAYYHITEAGRYVDALGFPGLLRAPQAVKVHATGLAESWYSPTERRIYLGDGGVDDAEDADIILHEFGHVLHDAAVGSFGTGETAALSEGFADYFAATRTGDAAIGNWDAAHHAQGCYRDLTELRRYPADLCGEPHADGLIWGGLLWRLHEALGSETADRLALAALYFQTPRGTMEAAAQGLLAVARELDVDAVVAEALAVSGLGAREGRAALALGSSAPELVLPYGFTFRGPGMAAEVCCDSLVVGSDGRLVMRPRGPGPAPLLAPLMAHAQEERAYDALEVAWHGTLERLALDLRFRRGVQVVRHVTTRIASTGTIEIEWYGEGDLCSVPALAGWFPAGVEAPYLWVAPTAEPEISASAGEGLAIDLSANPFPLAGGLWSLAPAAAGGYRAQLLRAPSIESAASPNSLRIFPAPAGPESRVQFRAPTRGNYTLRIIAPDGRASGTADLGTLDPGRYEYALEKILGHAGRTTGMYHVQLRGPHESQVGRILLLQ